MEGGAKRRNEAATRREHVECTCAIAQTRPERIKGGGRTQGKPQGWESKSKAGSYVQKRPLGPEDGKGKAASGEGASPEVRGPRGKGRDRASSDVEGH